MVDDRMHDKAVLEAALFLSPEPLSLRALAKLLDASQPYVRALLEEMQNDLLAVERGLEIQIDQTRASFQVKRSHVDRVAHLAPQQDIQRSVLRTLAVVAYNQPVTQADVVKVRGNKAYAHIQELLERGLIRSEQQGRTQLLEVTDEFLRYFGLGSREEFRFHFTEADAVAPDPANEQDLEPTGKQRSRESGSEGSDPAVGGDFEPEARSFEPESDADARGGDRDQPETDEHVLSADDVGTEAGG